MSVYDWLLQLRRRGAGFFVLLDPDDHPPAELGRRARQCREAGVDALLVGGSLILQDGFHEAVAAVKEACDLPLILFPGSPGQLSPQADALLFLSLISGRNAQHLIGDQVAAAPAVRKLGLEAIPTGYMLVASGTVTAVEFISGTRPLPRDKPELAAAHALAGQYLGLKLLYLEAGSGAREPVPEEMVAAVRRWVDLPLIVGGGLRTPQAAAARVAAGADFIVVGTALGEGDNPEAFRRFAEAVHEAGEK